MTINGQGGAPNYDFSTTSKQCKTFEGTNLKDCPEVGYAPTHYTRESHN